MFKWCLLLLFIILFADRVHSTFTRENFKGPRDSILEWKCLRANIEITTKIDSGVYLKCLTGRHCLIAACLGAGFLCLSFSFCPFDTSRMRVVIVVIVVIIISIVIIFKMGWFWNGLKDLILIFAYFESEFFNQFPSRLIWPTKKFGNGLTWSIFIWFSSNVVQRPFVILWMETECLKYDNLQVLYFSSNLDKVG